MRCRGGFWLQIKRLAAGRREKRLARGVQQREFDFHKATPTAVSPGRL